MPCYQADTAIYWRKAAQAHEPKLNSDEVHSSEHKRPNQTTTTTLSFVSSNFTFWSHYFDLGLLVHVLFLC